MTDTKERKCNPAARKRRGRGAVFLVSMLLLFSVGMLPVAADNTAAGFPKDAVTTPILYNGTEILNGECVRIAGVTYVPFRNFCTLFGNGKVTWNAASGTASYTDHYLDVSAKTGTLYIKANEHYFYTVSEIRNFAGRIYVPIRPMAKAFDLSLDWNAKKNCVELSAASARHAVAPANYNADDVYWLSRIISAEAGGEPFRGQIAVGNVVLNRVASREYPNSIWGVIFDRKYGTQFSPVSFGTIYNKPTSSAVIAAKICLEGYTLSDDILYFMNPRIATTNWISRNRPYAFTVGNHDFYY